MLLGLALGFGFGGSLLLLIAAFRGWKPERKAKPARSAGRGNLLFGTHARRRLAIAIGAGLLVAVMTRWPVAAVAVGALIWLWPTMFGAGKSGEAKVDRLDALATWTESLRDSIAGSIGLEQAIKHSIHAAPPVLHPQLLRLDGRLRARIPLAHALTSFAAEFDDSSADLVVGALVLNSQLRGPGLVQTLTALATSAREELEMRRRVEEGRKSLRRTALIIVIVTAVFAGGLTLLSRDYVAPYSTPFGQVMLAVVLGVFATGLMWIRKAANITAPERFLVGPEGVDQALGLNVGGAR